MIALKWRVFDTARELAQFCADGANGVVVIVSITYDASSGKHNLFYTV
jgi:hypothetical protein